MELIYLTADMPLVKTFSFRNKEVIKTPYPNAYKFTSHANDCESLNDFMEALEEAIENKGCLLKGTLEQPLDKEPRAGSTDTHDETGWVCLDIDGLKGYDSVDNLLKDIGLSDVSYIMQPSASSIIQPTGIISAHVFMLLNDPVAAPFLKQWLTHLNLKTPAIREAITLTRTAHALRWPLDITCCQNDKLIFVAQPQLEGQVPKTIDTNKFKPVLVKRKLSRIPTERIKANFAVNKSSTQSLLNELRKAAGHEKMRASQYKYAGSITYIDKPDSAILTGIKKERGFVYLNLNGGDSWGYYHPEDNNEFVYNFKGEPAYKTKELLPDYWNDCEEEKANLPAPIKYFVGRDFHTDRFFNGMFDTTTQKLTIARASTEARLISFLKQHGQPVPDFIQDWTIGYFPNSEVRFDEENHVINTYVPSDYYKLKIRESKRVPQVIRKVIESAVGEEETYEHFLNWLACIVQHRKKTQTCWVLHGIQGTGKGLLMHNIITPLLGASNTAMLQMSQLEEHYNGWAENTLLTMIDEAQIRMLRQNNMIHANLKTIITDPILNIRRMYSEPYKAASYVNLIFASNQPDPVQIDSNDRRFNVGKYQTKRLKITNDEVKEIESELENMFMYLQSRETDMEKARMVMQSADRKLLINISQSSIDSIADKILTGDLQFFIDQLPNADSAVFNTPACIAYRALIEFFITSKPDTLLRDELFVLLDYCIGDMPRSPHKFTSLLKHHRIYTTKVRRDGQQQYGIEVQWQMPETIPAKQKKSKQNVIPMQKRK